MDKPAHLRCHPLSFSAGDWFWLAGSSGLVGSIASGVFSIQICGRNKPKCGQGACLQKSGVKDVGRPDAALQLVLNLF